MIFLLNKVCKKFNVSMKTKHVEKHTHLDKCLTVATLKENFHFSRHEPSNALLKITCAPKVLFDSAESFACVFS